jgi:hypothetical protein
MRISLTDVRDRADLAEEKKTATDWEQAVLVAGFTRPVLERVRSAAPAGQRLRGRRCPGGGRIGGDPESRQRSCLIRLDFTGFLMLWRSVRPLSALLFAAAQHR